MRTALLQKVLSCFMLVVVPAALFAADASVAAMLYSNGTTPSWLQSPKVVGHFFG